MHGRLRRNPHAGLAFLDELAENPAGEPARVLLAMLDRRLTRKTDRARFGLVEAAAPVVAGGETLALGADTEPEPPKLRATT
jgi:hypothetical protein